jgi:hypothetical protein
LGKHALALLVVAAFSASCGGESKENRRRESEGASGSTRSSPTGESGKTSAAAGTPGAGASPGSGTADGSGGTTAGSSATPGGSTSGGQANSSTTGGATDLHVGGSGAEATQAAGKGGTSSAGANAAGSTSFGGLSGMTGAGGNAGRGVAGDDSTAIGAAGTPDSMPLQGGVEFALEQTADYPNRVCPSGTGTGGLGNAGLTYRIGDTFDGHYVVNGTNGVVMSCRLGPGNNGTVASGNISGTATATVEEFPDPSDTDPPQVDLTFSYQTEDNESSRGDPTMTMSYYSSDVGTLLVPDGYPECTIHFTASSGGFLLGVIDCPLIATPGDDSTGCHLQGTLIFLNCDPL